MNKDDLKSLFSRVRATPVRLPELGEDAVVYLRPMLVEQLLDIERTKPADDADPRARAEWMARAVVYAVADQGGQPLLTAADVPWVMTWPGSCLGRVFREAAALSALTDERVEGAAKN